MNLNKVFLIGRLGADPDVRYTADGTAIANFRIATTEVWKDRNNNKQERTEWHSIVAWRRLGEIAKDYLKKGMLVYIEGRIQSREYEGRDNTKRRVTEIIAVDLKLFPKSMTPISDDRRPQTQDKPQVDDVFVPEIEEDDLPM
ncbi:MAG TPA: single-stranded DNA-binding protein [Syntrophorhabdaceae bacterium]|nr:single-stranded DNA-binding protein [Syntrophorhabdaceae bacterium]HOL04809.1 single-stranded DNA-binding protein [Syntrophorhabdaceae bacterium]HON85509.1 single-stranded DNA-binding protein [Syntrophorhabdaceae bacterium]HOT42995.1 single-stranded DNA-binding protein [Syntrophorhabdaceae bacterium]HPC65911.1 single-stranded DNA-binding protein [Syntrophorhabdaceae bacterium]